MSSKSDDQLEESYECILCKEDIPESLNKISCCNSYYHKSCYIEYIDFETKQGREVKKCMYCQQYFQLHNQSNNEDELTQKVNIFFCLKRNMYSLYRFLYGISIISTIFSICSIEKVVDNCSGNEDCKNTAFYHMSTIYSAFYLFLLLLYLVNIDKKINKVSVAIWIYIYVTNILHFILSLVYLILYFIDNLSDGTSQRTLNYIFFTYGIFFIYNLFFFIFCILCFSNKQIIPVVFMSQLEVRAYFQAKYNYQEQPQQLTSNESLFNKIFKIGDQNC